MRNLFDAIHVSLPPTRRRLGPSVAAIVFSAAAFAAHPAAAQINHNDNPGLLLPACQSPNQYKASTLKTKVAGLEEKKKALEAKKENAQHEIDSLSKTSHKAGSAEAQISDAMVSHKKQEIAKYQSQIDALTAEINAASGELASINQCSG